ncbi:Sulfite reductase, alpha subunit (flavoprotein) [Mariniphaga anaerophila]|uniref:Sulfite reductase, alpha subunit (Flavoprotein) n=1 Tax=Mariniphaga anaerophila TaxID=1484053 RepID=A0A1M4VS71_9BACT|nr:sulfite reductase flavoprotein subunit alpha [Mariniphaga anaerophila]SHE71894.1 Sulfite reductase, alpha subunit (flavoprotein) [Mariniphaga anaerophila]
MTGWFKKSVRLLHLWAGLLSGTVIFIVCLTGSLYVFRAPIENSINYKTVFVEDEKKPFVLLDSIQNRLALQGFTINTITIYGKPNRSHEIGFTATDGSDAGTFYVNPYSGKILGKRNTTLSPAFEFILALHKNLLLSNTGKQVVGASVLIFVFMLFSGFVLWLPRKMREFLSALHFNRKSVKLIDLHKIPGFYSLALLFVIAVMGLYISYPWVKSALIVSFGGNPVLSKASEKQEAKIKAELASSFSNLLKKQLASKSEEVNSGKMASLDSVVSITNNELPYPGITTINLPTAENSWIKVRKINRNNWVRAIVFDELEFNKQGQITAKKLFENKTPDQKFVALSLPLHTGEILGWPSLILYFIVSLTGTSLPVTGTILWAKRKRARLKFKRKTGTRPISIPDAAEMNTDNWLIVYATRSGNAKMIATTLQAQFKRLGLPVKTRNISTLTSAQLKSIKYLFIAISTDGNGIPPPSAKNIFTELKNSDYLLNSLNYSVCALGDSAYDAFCQAGKNLDKYLRNKGANSIIQRVDCDADFSEPSTKWINQSIRAVLLNEKIELTKELKTNVEITKKEFRQLQVKEIAKLSNGNLQKPCYHIVLQSDENLSSIKPGDSIEIFPQNPEWLVTNILNALQLPSNKKVRDWLLNECEITTLNKTTIEKYNYFAENRNLTRLLNDGASLRKYLAKANFHDLIVDFPAAITEKQLKETVPGKKGRLYSAASSTAYFPNEIHLTVKTIRYTFQSRKHEGAGSIELTNNLVAGDTIRFRHYPNLEFRLPENTNAPLILIGIGTGIAPFRAFLQQNEFDNSNREIWLIWGDKNRENDFLYEKELLDFKEKNSLTKLDTAFSRDGNPKVYVQHLVEQNESDFIRWMNKGAHVFVCGSINMAEGTKTAIEKVLNNHSASTITFHELIEQQRYHEDTY